MGIRLENKILKHNSPDSQVLLHNLSKAILNGEMSITKIVGINLVDFDRRGEVTLMERSQYCMQSILEVANRLNKLSFFHPLGVTGTAIIDKGKITSNDLEIVSGGYPITPIQTDVELMDCTGKLKLQVVFREAEGSKDLDDNFKYIKSILKESAELYFPCQSLHSIGDVFRLRCFLNANGEIEYSHNPNINLELVEQILEDCVETKGW